MKQAIGKHQLCRRVQVEGTAIVHNSHRILELKIVNLSKSGIFLRQGKTKMFPVGQTLFLTLKSDRFPLPIAVRGTVVRTQSHSPQGIGIEFLEVSKEALEILQTSISEIRVEIDLNEKRDLC